MRDLSTSYYTWCSYSSKPLTQCISSPWYWHYLEWHAEMIGTKSVAFSLICWNLNLIHMYQTEYPRNWSASSMSQLFKSILELDFFLTIIAVDRIGDALRAPAMIPSNHKPELTDRPNWALVTLDWPTQLALTNRACHTLWYLLLKPLLPIFRILDYYWHHYDVTQLEVLQ